MYRNLIYDKVVIKFIKENINYLMNYVEKVDDNLEKNSRIFFFSFRI